MASWAGQLLLEVSGVICDDNCSLSLSAKTGPCEAQERASKVLAAVIDSASHSFFARGRQRAVHRPNQWGGCIDVWVG